MIFKHSLSITPHEGKRFRHENLGGFINRVGSGLHSLTFSVHEPHPKGITSQFSTFLLLFFPKQNKNKELPSSKSHSSATTPKSEEDQTSISFSNESIKKQEPKTQVNIVISYIEKNEEQGIGQSVKQLLSLVKLSLRIGFSFILVYSHWQSYRIKIIELNSIDDKMNAKLTSFAWLSYS